MKLPEYSLKQAIQLPNRNNNDVTEFKSGTLIRPFWNEDFLPDHIKQELKEVSRFRLKTQKYIMCLIGQTWVPVYEDNIRSSN